MVIFAETRSFSKPPTSDKTFSNDKFGIYSMASAGYLSRMKCNLHPGDHPYMATTGELFAVTADGKTLMNLVNNKTVRLNK